MMDTETGLVGGSQGYLRWFFGVPLRAQTYRNLAYLLLAFPLGLAYFVFFVVGFSVGAGLLILVVGVVILALTVLFGLALASFDRILTNWILGTSIVGRTTLEGESHVERAKDLTFDRRTWTSLLYLPVKFVLGVVSLVVIFVGFSTAGAMVMVPLYYQQPGIYIGVLTDRAPEVSQTLHLGWNYLLVTIEGAVTLGYWEIQSLPAAITVAGIGILSIFVTFHLCNLLAWVWSTYAYWTFDGGFDLIGAMSAASQE